MANVVSVFPNEKKTLHTTRSWDFMGFSQQVRRTTLESDIIIGVLDTGIWPESESFNDEGFGPPPSKWKGSCQASSNFSCNKRPWNTYSIHSSRGLNGHGKPIWPWLGTARGGVPSARIAVYKICWSDGCSDADILAAFDDAIADGVDIISLSVGGKIANDYFNDSIAIGTFHAMKNGILTSTSAGNEGPLPASIKNFSPWSLSVAASTIDRKFETKVQLGNKKIYEGVSINTFDLKNAMYPLIYGGDAPNITGNFTGSQSRFCSINSLDANLVKGKIVLCDLSTGEGPLLAGAIGTVMQGQGPRDRAFSFPLPTAFLGPDEGADILSFINSTSNATAIIRKSNVANNSLAPFVPSFSSRGPNPITPDILKPDIAAPGVDIIAAWSLASSVTGLQGDNRFVPYNIISGTSMACPHATGAAAYVKSHHPKWSPSAIKSALMTTASPMSSATNPEAEFAYGVGHINPVKAINPGLIYDAQPLDYVKFLCGQGYNSILLQLVTGDKSTCSKAINATVWDLNYPSFALSATRLEFVKQVFNRIVTNVGSPTSKYKATVTAPPGLKIQVKPSILSFTSLGEKKAFALTVEGRASRSMVSASLVWDDGKYQVRSPVVMHVIP
ncbi:hypothetical protein GH714_036414 [Hevea brasiliensis]|uniref:Cucumisin-like n=1 Tax=Hevea brasiliensis TaxID=3981 RepID=A0A6A6L6B7_HEVBR|nr:hypothetical protein GH714_036414 [Hevea brasiliensis]